MGEGKWRETIGTGFGTGRNKGTTQKHPVVNEYTGREGGYHVEHWDDRVDAVVKPDALNLQLSAREDA